MSIRVLANSFFFNLLSIFIEYKYLFLLRITGSARYRPWSWVWRRWSTSGDATIWNWYPQMINKITIPRHNSLCVRSVLSRAELDALPLDNNLKDDVERGKVISTNWPIIFTQPCIGSSQETRYLLLRVLSSVVLSPRIICRVYHNIYCGRG